MPCGHMGMVTGHTGTVTGHTGIVTGHTRLDTLPGISRGGWAGAVMWWAGALEEAVYTTASVICNWAGAEIQKPLAKYRKKNGCRTDIRTDGHTLL